MVGDKVGGVVFESDGETVGEWWGGSKAVEAWRG